MNWVSQHRSEWPHFRHTGFTGFLFLLWLTCVSGWDKDGHEAIGMTAMSALQNGPASEVKRLMGGKDAVDVAAWAHKVNKKYPFTNDLHFQVQPAWQCSGVNTSHCPEKRCLLNAIKHFYGRLVHKPLVDLEWPEKMNPTDADSLKFLINLIGDLHQPLHLGFDEGDMGREIKVFFRGSVISLYELFDAAISQAVINDTPNFWWSGWTHVTRTRSQFDRDTDEWKSKGIDLIDKWAAETVHFACTTVYVNPVTGQNITDELNDGVFRVDESVYSVWKHSTLNQLLIAGARVAIVLNSILQHREGQLKAGTGVTDVEDEDEDGLKEVRGRKGDILTIGKPVQGPAALGMNFGIFCVVFVIFLYVMRIWYGKDPVAQADRAKMQETGKKI